MAAINIRSLKFAILRSLVTYRNGEHKFNLIGKGYGESPLERAVGSRLSSPERHLAVVAFQELISAELIRPTYTDLTHPEEWVEVTDAGRAALHRRELDALDAALAEISPHLIELRAGAWAAIASLRPDGLRQAAHSGRELIDQTLKEGAPDDAVRLNNWFVPVKDSRSGITRRHRLRHLMEKRRGSLSESELEIADRACDLVVATDNRLTAIAHARSVVQGRDVRQAIEAAEIALSRVLLPE